jgi:hypothetical protein
LAVVPTSAVTGDGVEELKRLLFELVPKSVPAPQSEQEIADFLVYRPRPPRQRSTRVYRTEHGWLVRGEATEEQLRAAGVGPDDVVERERQ